jgi:SAM-dependent methyltransferase
VRRHAPGYGSFYRFALAMGLRHVAHGDFSLGARKTLGKLFQPINAISRFPEYALFYRLLAPALAGARVPTLLDLGSPKPFGLYLATHAPVEAVLTDINAANYRDYEQLWRRSAHRARGRAVFREMDARRTQLAGASFDVVISMSVVEHIEGEGGDRQALAEMWRLLCPGGLLVVSVPFGSTYVSQNREGFSYFEDGHARRHQFFQRIYDTSSLEAALPRDLAEVARTTAFVHRVDGVLLRAYRRLGLDARALAGPLSPVLARVMMRTSDRFDDRARAVESYGETSRIDDVYSDAVLSWRKPE